ncbi:unnamed protein product, partial [Musa acuminata var. zebrina]
FYHGGFRVHVVILSPRRHDESWSLFHGGGSRVFVIASLHPFSTMIGKSSSLFHCGGF